MLTFNILSSYINGVLFSLRHHSSVGKWLRIYRNVTLSFHKGCYANLGNNVKINKNSTVSVLSRAKLSIQDNVSIGEGSYIVAHDCISIGVGTIMGQNVMIYDHDHKFAAENGVNRKEYNTSPVSIGKNCWIGANTVILRGTSIGDNCVVGAGCVLKGMFPNGSVIIQKRVTDVIQKNN